VHGRISYDVEDEPVPVVRRSCRSNDSFSASIDAAMESFAAAAAEDEALQGKEIVASAVEVPDRGLTILTDRVGAVEATDSGSRVGVEDEEYDDFDSSDGSWYSDDSWDSYSGSSGSDVSDVSEGDSDEESDEEEEERRRLSIRKRKIAMAAKKNKKKEYLVPYLLRRLNEMIVAALAPVCRPVTQALDKLVFDRYVNEQMSAALHPSNSKRRRYWESFIFVLIVYNLMVVPFLLTVGWVEKALYVDYCFDLVLICDAILNWTVFSVVHNGELIVDRAKIRELYCADRLLLDLLRVAPIDIASVGVRAYSTRSLLRTPKLLWIVSIMPYYQQMMLLFEEFKVHFLLTQLLKVLFAIGLLAHWSACGFYYMAASVAAKQNDCTPDPNEFAVYGTACEYEGTWVQWQIYHGRVATDGSDDWTRYLRALAYSLPTLVLMSIADVIPANEDEIFYAFWVMFFTVAMNSVIIGSVISVTYSMGDKQATLVSKREALHAYLVRNRADEALIERATSYLTTLSSEYGQVVLHQEAAFSITELPFSLHTAVNMALKTPYLRQCPVFDFIDDGAVAELSSKLKLQCYGMGDNVMTFGELGTDMFFIDRGKCEVVAADDVTVFAVLQEGAFFGETALFFKQTRTATIRAADHATVLFSLSKRDLNLQLRSMEFDIEATMGKFEALQQSNTRRNRAVQVNLQAVATPGTKLSRMIVRKETAKQLSLLDYIKIYAFSPTSPFRLFWKCVGLLFLLYYVVAIPYDFAFMYGGYFEDYMHETVYLDFLIDSFFILDILVNAVALPFVNNKGAVENDSELIFARYRSTGHFYDDIMASLPLELLVLLPGVDTITLFVLRFVHLVRVIQLNLYVTDIQVLVGSVFKVRLKRSYVVFFKAVSMWGLGTHWCACIMFGVPRFWETSVANTWPIQDQIAELAQDGTTSICSVELFDCYSRTLYAVVSTCANIGYGDIVPYTNSEVIVQLFTCLLGAYITANLVGSFTVYFQEAEDSGLAPYHSRLREVQSFVRSKQLKPSLQRMILAHFAFIWEKEQRVDSEQSSLLHELSEPLVLDISFELHRSFIQATPVISSIQSNHIQKRVAAALSPQVHARGDAVYESGDPGNCLFFIASGWAHMKLPAKDEISSLDTYNLDSLPILQAKHTCCRGQLARGDHFGELCFLSHAGIHAESVKVTSPTVEICAVSKEAFWHVLLFMPMDDRRDLLIGLMSSIKGHTFIADTPSAPPAAAPPTAAPPAAAPSVTTATGVPSKEAVPVPLPFAGANGGEDRPARATSFGMSSLKAEILRAMKSHQAGPDAPQVVPDQARRLLDAMDPMDRHLNCFYRLSVLVMHLVLARLEAQDGDGAGGGTTFSEAEREARNQRFRNHVSTVVQSPALTPTGRPGLTKETSFSVSALRHTLAKVTSITGVLAMGVSKKVSPSPPISISIDTPQDLPGAGRRFSASLNVVGEGEEVSPIKTTSDVVEREKAKGEGEDRAAEIV